MTPLLGTRPRPAPPLVGLDERQRRVTYSAAAVLLRYPDAELLDALPVVRAAVAELPDGVRAPLAALAAHLAAGPPAKLAADFVATFDLQRRCSPYLTYYTYGDTRKRGLALLRVKQAYARAGFTLTEEELPDHLAVLCEFAAGGPLERADRLFAEHRVGLELLRLALQDAGSPYAGVVDAVSRTLPALPGRDRDTVLALAREGPPVEEVGLEGYPIGVPEGGRR